MGLDGLQQLHVVVVGHFVAVLLPVLPGAEHVGRVGVNQDVLVIKPPDELHRRSVLDLDAPEPLRRLDDDLRGLGPAFGGVGRLPALHVIFPADLFTGRAEAVAHHHTDVKIDRPPEVVRLGVLGRPGPVVFVPCVWREAYGVGQPCRVFPDPIEQVDDVAVDVVDGLDGAAGFGEQYGPGSEERL